MNNKVGKLIICRGLPGSGKSTFAKQLQAKTNCEHYENDMYFMQDGVYKYEKEKYADAVKWCHESTFNALLNGKNVVVTNVFASNKTIKFYVDKAKQLNIPFKIFRKTSQYKNIHNVPENVLHDMKKHFQNCPGEILIK